MLKKIFRVLSLVAGGSVGYVAGAAMLSLFKELRAYQLYILGFFTVFFAIIFYLLSDKMFRGLKSLGERVERELRKYSTGEIRSATLGIIIGLLIAFLLSGLFKNLSIPFLSLVLSLISYILVPYLAMVIATKRGDILPGYSFKKSNKGKNTSGTEAKVLDTSVIIDGRIESIIKTGFIDGPIVIPQFVLDELQHVADSQDAIKRRRGRRGLDILKKIQEESTCEIVVDQNMISDIKETDSKLLKLAEMLNAKVLTNDYNLNKVAAVKGIEVLNINELANAIKPVVLPSEDITVEIVREGKEKNQGLAYLSDGTMIVVENGAKLIGKTLDVEVTTVLQTAAGKMIFAKVKQV